MRVERYEPSMAGALTAVYNEAVRGVPHCYPVSEERFAAALAAAGGEGEAAEGLRSEAAFAAADGGVRLGYVHVGLTRASEEEPEERAVIRFLSYPRGQRRVGEALLDAAERYAREASMARIAAFMQEHRYEFYHFRSAFLSDHLAHVQALLAWHGYRRSRGEVFFDWPEFEPVTPVAGEVAAEIRVEEREGRGKRPGLRLTAHAGGKQLGECVCVSAGEWHEAEEAQDWVFTTWLGVEREAQGKGLGRQLLQSALREARRLGYRHAGISTGMENHRAFLFYSNHGYGLGDWTYEFERALEPG